ncbi:MAG: hypothetical protein NDJ92_14450 [Thermoanaerobaculia bacterium]|nr:hypothetical protein [Thermoanaerobaculia bacterium]
MTGVRLVAGILVMGIAVPLLLFSLLELQTLNQLVTLSLVCFFSWGVADLMAAILERPRLKDRTAKGAWKDWEKKDG